MSPPHRYNSHMQNRPLQRIRKPSSKFRRKRPVTLQISLIPKIRNKQNELKHQRIIEISQLHPEKQIQLTRKHRSNQQGDSNTIRK